MADYLLSEKEFDYMIKMLTEAEGRKVTYATDTMEIEAGLTQKGFLLMDFDGNKDAAPELASLLNGMIRCTERISISKRGCGQGKSSEIIYHYSPRGFVRAEALGNDLRLSFAEKESLSEDLHLPELHEPSERRISGVHTIKMEKEQRISDAAKVGKDTEAEDMLKENGVPAEMGRMMMGVINGSVGMYSVLFERFSKGREKALSINALCGDRYLKAEVTNEDYEDAISYEECDAETLIGLVNAAVEEYLDD
ncbi:MAG: hypothetical protein IKI75_07830 [Lachnospiraceae bacterium]|nr:hypothetical protein [Lachnospiraceae bacterium]